MNTGRVLAVVAAVLATGCMPCLDGDGDVRIEERDVGAFTGVVLDGVGQVYVRQSGTQAVWVETDDNIQKHVQTRIDGHDLVLDIQDGMCITPTTLAYTV